MREEWAGHLCASFSLTNVREQPPLTTAATKKKRNFLSTFLYNLMLVISRFEISITKFRVRCGRGCVTTAIITLLSTLFSLRNLATVLILKLFYFITNSPTFKQKKTKNKNKKP